MGASERLDLLWWHYTTVVLQADVLFTGGRNKDPVDGPAFRALRDLNRSDLADRLHQALDLQATANGRTLRDVIGRVRNSLAHNSFRLDDEGDNLLHWGQDNETSMQTAFGQLIEATAEAALAADQRKHAIITELSLGGRVQELQQYIGQAADRAREKARRRRRAQARAARQDTV